LDQWTTIDSVALCLFLAQQVLPVVSVLMLLSGIDDLLIDVLYCVRRVWRRLTVYRHHVPMTANDLLHVPLKPLAVMIPAWDESAVIGDMLRTSTRLWPDQSLHFYVGIYPNDADGLTILQRLTAQDHRIRLVKMSRNGPTTKAHCLNEIFNAILATERTTQLLYDAFLLHDAEDLVSASEPYVISHLIDRKDVLQFPVRPLIVPGSTWVSGHYLDEFAESHGKDLRVREFLGANLPSAGVGCAFSRRALVHAAKMRRGNPFDETSVTEDYELALRLGQQGFQTAFIHLNAGPATAYIATEEHFPDQFLHAVKQKSRWLLGITLQGWDRLGWHGSWANRYMLLRDRKALLTAYLNAFAFSLAIIFSALWIWQLFDSGAPHFPALRSTHRWIPGILMLNGYFLMHRMCVRAAFVWRYHGVVQALLSFPRTIVANAINFAAACRAVRLYLRHKRTRRPVVWDKTAHRYPLDGVS
jgi:bacteriophage N4 adsorption protein B